MFECDRCGLCCQNIGGIKGYEDLDNGKGACKYFDLKKSLCMIYENRPLKCRIDEAYEIVYKQVMPKEVYYKLNYEACKKLKSKGGD